MMNTGEFVIVSGGAGGIGFETARSCLEKSWTPILIGRNQARLKAASESLNKCPYYSVDLSKPDCKKELKSIKIDGKLIGVVNNAGVFTPNEFKSSDFETWKRHFDSNVLSAVFLTQVFLDKLKQDKGAVVNVSSTLGIRPISNTAAYSASKAALNNLTQSLALELAPDVRVNSVCPGIVNTPIHDQQRKNKSVEDWKEELKSMQPLNRVGSPKDISPHIIHFLSPSSSWVTGTVLNIDGGILLKS